MAMRRRDRRAENVETAERENEKHLSGQMPILDFNQASMISHPASVPSVEPQASVGPRSAGPGDKWLSEARAPRCATPHGSICQALCRNLFGAMYCAASGE